MPRRLSDYWTVSAVTLTMTKPYSQHVKDTVLTGRHRLHFQVTSVNTMTGKKRLTVIVTAKNESQQQSPCKLRMKRTGTSHSQAHLIPTKARTAPHHRPLPESQSRSTSQTRVLRLNSPIKLDFLFRSLSLREPRPLFPSPLKSSRRAR